MSPVTTRIPHFRSGPEMEIEEGDIPALARFLRTHPKLLVLTGAGCSIGSGIPAYRDSAGQWLRRDPIQYQDFLKDPRSRRRYWARSFFGWPAMAEARPNRAHRALCELENRGRLVDLITQNVDGLHARAGSRDPLELHGSLARVECLDCDYTEHRDRTQSRMQACNPDWNPRILESRPDGDVELDEQAYPGFSPPDCPACGGRLKPRVVFFGESVPRQRLDRIRQGLDQCQALLIVGTSLVVFSGFRIVREAAAAGIPVVSVNPGRTRADELLAFRVPGYCDQVLPEAVSLLDQP